MRCESIAPGLPVEKCVDARPVEFFTWRSPLQLAAHQDRQRGLEMAFHCQGSSRLRDKYAGLARFGCGDCGRGSRLLRGCA